MSLISNILSNYNFLKQDYTGISINPHGIPTFLINCAIPLALVIIFFLIGEKIQRRFLKNSNEIIGFFISITLGFIFISSLILILGMLGLFYLNILYAFYGILIVVAIFPLSTLSKRLLIFKTVFKDYRAQFLTHKLANIAILAFVLIGFLRLVPGEVGVDAAWYHTDYPKIYLQSHTMMTINPQGKYYPAVTPTLSDMLYVVTESLSQKDSSRYIHFGFYVLVLLELLLLFRRRFPFIPYAALLLTTSPVVIRIFSSAYAEFPWMICWLLAIFLITEKNKHSYKDLILPAILLGGALATKIWMLPFYGVFILYIAFLNLHQSKIQILKYLIIFTVITFTVPFLWYLRAFIITGDPFFPTYRTLPLGTSDSPLTSLLGVISTFSPAGIRDRLVGMLNLSPFSIIGLVFGAVYLFRIKRSVLKKRPIVLFIIIITITQLIINYSYHRFLLPFYSVFAIALAIGIDKFISFNKLFKLTFYSLFLVFFAYYFINTLLILPYGLGFADGNKYLSRILSRDNSTYYDYNHQFSKFIPNNELVATYGLWAFYYANFNNLYSEDVFMKKPKSLASLKQAGVTKLIILGLDMNWFCKVEKITDCTPNNYKLLTSYKFPTETKEQALYLLK